MLPLERTVEGEIALERRQVFGKVIIRSDLTACCPRISAISSTCRSRLTPDRRPCLQDDVVLTFAELDARVSRMANALRGLGVGPGDRVALMFNNDFRFLESLFGPMRLGAVAVPLNTRLRHEALRFVVDDAEAGVMSLQPRHGSSAP